MYTKLKVPQNASKNDKNSTQVVNLATKLILHFSGFYWFCHVRTCFSKGMADDDFLF